MEEFGPVLDGNLRVKNIQTLSAKELKGKICNTNQFLNFTLSYTDEKKKTKQNIPVTLRTFLNQQKPLRNT